MFPTIEDFQRLFIDPLPLPDNRDARQLRWLELSRALEPVLPDYDPSDGKQALLAKYARKLAAHGLRLPRLPSRILSSKREPSAVVRKAMTRPTVLSPAALAKLSTPAPTATWRQ